MLLQFELHLQRARWTFPNGSDQLVTQKWQVGLRLGLVATSHLRQGHVPLRSMVRSPLKPVSYKVLLMSTC